VPGPVVCPEGGTSLKMALNLGTPGAKTILDVPDYSFHYQRVYNSKTPVKLSPGDRVQVTCTYNPTLAQQLPILRKIAPHFVTWVTDPPTRCASVSL
jgi:copper type II ascorbate-dependent monooxygenase-like protein